MAAPLSLDDFLELLDRYGSDLTTWQLAPSEIEAVAELLAQSSEARSRVMEMRFLESQLRGAVAPAPEGLADRVLAAAGVIAVPNQSIQARPRERRPVLN